MEQLIEFAGNHLFLLAAFTIVTLMLVQNLAADAGGKGSVDPHQATDLINRQEAVVVDVRPMADFLQRPHHQRHQHPHQRLRQAVGATRKA
jgi:hypothetical protein